MAATNLERYTGTPEDQAKATEMYLYGLQGMGLGTAAQAVPPVAGGADRGDWRNWVPGLPSTLYNWGGSMLGMLGTGLLKSGEYDVNGQPVIGEDGQPIKMPTVTVPGTDAARRMKENSVATTMNLIPHAEAKTEQAQVGQDIGLGLAEGATTGVPEIGLPKVAGQILHLVAPPLSPGAAGIGAGIGGTLGAFEGTPGAEGKVVPLDQPTQPDQPAAKSGAALPPGWEAPTQATQAAVQPQQGALPPGWEAPTAAAPLPEGWEAPVKTGLRPSSQGLSPENDTGFTFGQYTGAAAAVALGAWVAAKHGPAMINTISDALHGVGRDVGAANAELASGIPRPPTAKPFEMPLPNDAGGATRRWAANNYNPNAVINTYSKSRIVSATPAEADARIAANEMINNPANAQRAMEHTFRTGIEEGTKHVFPPIVDYRQTVDALTPEQQTAFHNGAWYGSELNLRNQNISEAANKGVMWTPETDGNYRVSFPDKTTDELRAYVNAAKSDPQVAAALDQNKAIQLALVDSNELRGGITKQQADYARKWYPDFMPTIGVDGNYIHSWDGKLRDVASGYNTAPAPAWEAMINHFDRSLRDMQLKDWQRGIILHQNAIQEADPLAAKVVTERRTPAVVGQADSAAPSGLNRTITIHTPTGQRHFDINNTAFFNGLRGGPQRMVISGSVANAARKTYQSMTTGLPAAALGHPFALKNFLRDTALVPWQAPKGMWRGELDRALNIRLPFDPTFLIGSGTTLMKDASTVVAKHAADIFSNRGNPAGASLRAMFGDAQTDAIVNWMRARIEHSNLATREAQGVGGGGSRMPLNMTSLVTDKAGTYRDPTAHSVAPNLGRVPSKLPLPARGAVRSYLRLNSLAQDLYNVISDAPHSYLYDLNRGNARFTPQVLAHHVQEVTGNPGTHGSGRLTSGAARNVAYYNTGLQAVGRSFAAYRDRPFLTGTSVATVLLSYALAEHLSALMSGKAHVNNLENQLANGTQVGNATIYHGPGTDPNDNTRIPIPNEGQHLWPYVSAVVGHTIGTWNAHADEDTLSRLIHTIAGVFSEHVSTDMVKQQAIGVVRAGIPSDIPPVIGTAVATLTGQTVKNIPETMATNAISGQPLFSGISSDQKIQSKVPGQEDTNGVMLRSDSGVMKAVMSSLGAGFATAYDLYNNFTQRMRDDPTWAWATHGLWQDYKQQWKDNTPLANTVWKNTMPMSTYGALEERTNQMWRPVAATANARTDIRAEGFNKATHGVPVIMTGNSPVPPATNPEMRGVYLTMAGTAKMINRVIMPRENQIRAQIDNVKSGGFMPDEERRLQNKLSSQLYEVTAQKHQMLLDLSARLSQQLGGRHVDLGRIDWSKGVDQFHY